MESKSVVVSLAKIFHDRLDVDENCSSIEFESSLSSKCRYLGKVVDDMKGVIYDNYKRMCNTTVDPGGHSSSNLCLYTYNIFSNTLLSHPNDSWICFMTHIALTWTLVLK